MRSKSPRLALSPLHKARKHSSKIWPKQVCGLKRRTHVLFYAGASALWLRLKFLEYSLAAKQKIGYTEGEADIFKKMASVRGEMGDMEAAKQLLETALQMQVAIMTRHFFVSIRA